jgi:NADH:ubiquinone oxidoreductase subunit 6 (subunit J)
MLRMESRKAKVEETSTMILVLAPVLLLGIEHDNGQTLYVVALCATLMILAALGGVWFKDPAHSYVAMLYWRIGMAAMLMIGFISIAIQRSVKLFGPAGAIAMTLMVLVAVVAIYRHALRKARYRNDGFNGKALGVVSAAGATLGALMIHLLGVATMTILACVVFGTLSIACGYMVADFYRELRLFQSRGARST